MAVDDLRESWDRAGIELATPGDLIMSNLVVQQNYRENIIMKWETIHIGHIELSFTLHFPRK